MTKLPIVVALMSMSAACGTAHAERVAVRPVLTTAQSPYSIELIGEEGLLHTYQQRGRFYVHGNSGERYSVRVSNPTDRRVEAVISVDGLDVIDGETADFAKKRGYIVPAHGSLLIDGFRVSTEAVAAFRFSSVANSYAGRKGKARNVGVIGVALFAEQEEAVLVLPTPRIAHEKRRRPSSGGSAEGTAADDFHADAQAPSRAQTGKSARPSAEPRASAQRERSGLGTEFGEHRQSAVQFTRFVRANAKKPTAIAELRYNDAHGLRALGIRLHEEVMIDDYEIITRETANPFPNSRFAQPPR